MVCHRFEHAYLEFGLRRRFVGDGGTGLGPHQRGTERRRGTHHADILCRRLFLHVTNQIVLGHVLTVTVVEDRNDGSKANCTVGSRGHDLCVVEDRLDLADATLHVPLLVLGSVVIAVFLEVAQCPRLFDLVGHLDAPPGGEVVQLGLEPIVCSLGEQVFRHAPKAI